MALEFTNKVVLITGSSSGIGEATAYEFIKLGAKVVVTGRSGDKLASVEKQCTALASKSGGAVLSVVADVTKDSDLDKLVSATLAKFGQIDVLVNNAGAGAATSILDPNVVPVYDNTMNINLRSVFVLTHKVIPHLVKTKGNIVNISSVAATKPHAAATVYCMAKAGLNMFTKCLALEVGPQGVRVNCIEPGMVRTNFRGAMGMDAEVSEKNYAEQEKHLPTRRIGTSEDMAHLIVFLASPKSINMTGSVVLSDGGYTWASVPPVKKD